MVPHRRTRRSDFSDDEGGASGSDGEGDGTDGAAAAEAALAHERGSFERFSAALSPRAKASATKDEL